MPGKTGLYDPAFEKDSCGIGFVCDIKGRSSHSIVKDAYNMNCCMEHRGGVGYEKNTGDGAGILTGIPHKLFSTYAQQEFGISLLPREYGVGIVFLPNDSDERARAKKIFSESALALGQDLIGWREVPIDPERADIGQAARSAMPTFEQVFISASNDCTGQIFEQKLYQIRKKAINQINSGSAGVFTEKTYACSLSSKTIVYKGMLTPEQLFSFYPDLTDEDYETHLAMVHSRFSTNTFPSWDRAQPNRFMGHNGEINTLLGNVNAMNARQGVIESAVFREELKELFPIIEPDCSDSGNFDNVLEFLLMNEKTLEEAILMMIPEAWQQHQTMSDQLKSFYEYNSCSMEPWDGPASIAFTDGDFIGAVLDRNGLRPSRYYITDDHKCIMASEVGVVDVDPAKVITKGRLQPGRIFLIDFDEGRMIPDHELKSRLSAKHPYRKWLDEEKIELSDLADSEAETLMPSELIPKMKAFGYTQETMQFMLQPMVTELRDPLGSMGNDAALAVISKKPRMLYDYFKQRFAQVTNPPIDSIREEVIMALECYIGPEQNLLDTNSANANRLKIPHPILANDELAKLKSIEHQGWRCKTIDITYPKEGSEDGLKQALHRINQESLKAIEQGYSLIILSDRKLSEDRLSISSLLAIGSVHHFLVKEHSRTKIGLILESGEAREVHHHCLLTGYGADAINPYLAFEALWDRLSAGVFPEINSAKDIVANYKKAVGKGMLKVMAKMGISTLHSYKGAQIFEAVGLAEEVIDLCFAGTASRIEGANFDVLSREMSEKHSLGFPKQISSESNVLINPGDFHWRRNGDTHMWDPSTIANLQRASRENNEEAYWQFSKQTNEENNRKASIRGLLRFKKVEPIELEKVETEKDIMVRFATGAMSFGSISAEAHESLAVAMNRIGGKSNTGEGGEDPARFIPLENGDSKRSAIKQVASGRFGVTINYLSNADELQIKIIQGAKPGEGGELPGGKVDDYIAKIRHSTPGVGLISPPPHHDIYSIEDIAQLIHDLKNANPDARVSVKLGSEVGVGTVAAGVTKARADHLVIAGDSGGTGASPLTSIKHAGIPWEIGIAETHQTLVLNNLRSRVVLQTDGQLKTGRDVAIAAILGAEEFGFATAPLIALGCIMMRKCHLNTCPVGIATQDPMLRKKFNGSPEHVINYLYMVAKELRQIMASLGIGKVNDLIGRVDLLEVDDALKHWKSEGLDLSTILTPVNKPDDFLGSFAIHSQDHELDKALDNQLIELAEPALTNGGKVRSELNIVNTNRVVGAMLSNQVIRRVGPQMLPDDTIHYKFNGSAGQSFGCWLAKGITLELEGDANDYTGKGLSGGKLIIYPPKESQFVPEENIILGNVALYGATSGECYFRGIAAERFCVRNSGATAVVEGVGDHGCEYMTGGTAVILGETGRNFAAGMSGGIAYIWDEHGAFEEKCNKELVLLESVSEDAEELKRLIQNHLSYTNSTRAKEILDSWEQALTQFIKVMPVDYKRVLEERKVLADAS